MKTGVSRQQPHVIIARFGPCHREPVLLCCTDKRSKRTQVVPGNLLLFILLLSFPRSSYLALFCCRASAHSPLLFHLALKPLYLMS